VPPEWESHAPGGNHPLQTEARAGQAGGKQSRAKKRKNISSNRKGQGRAKAGLGGENFGTQFTRGKKKKSGQKKEFGMGEETFTQSLAEAREGDEVRRGGENKGFIEHKEKASVTTNGRVWERTSKKGNTKKKGGEGEVLEERANASSP